MALLLKDGQTIANIWTAEGGDGEPLPDGPVIVSLDRWIKDRESLVARNSPVGVRLKSAERAEAIAADLDRLALVALEFPKFRDGRAFSTARELRERYGFTGEIRAVGHIIPDQYQFLMRTGFTTVEIPDSANPAHWRHALEEISVAYQGGLSDDTPLAGLRRKVGVRVAS